jgi:hypothetical protein
MRAWFSSDSDPPVAMQHPQPRNPRSPKRWTNSLERRRPVRSLTCSGLACSIAPRHPSHAIRGRRRTPWAFEAAGMTRWAAARPQVDALARRDDGRRCEQHSPSPPSRAIAPPVRLKRARRSQRRNPLPVAATTRAPARPLRHADPRFRNCHHRSSNKRSSGRPFLRSSRDVEQGRGTAIGNEEEGARGSRWRGHGAIVAALKGGGGGAVDSSGAERALPHVARARRSRPFSLERYFAPWRPVPLAPIGLDFLSARGMRLAAVELVAFAPLFVYALWPRPLASSGPR